MGFPSHLNGADHHLNGGQHIMKLRVLLTLIEDNINKISEVKHRKMIIEKVEMIRSSLPDFLFVNDSRTLSNLNQKLELKWNAIVDSQYRKYYVDTIQVLGEIYEFLNKYYVAICPNCGNEFPIEQGFIPKMLGKTNISCPNCKSTLPPKKG